MSGFTTTSEYPGTDLGPQTPTVVLASTFFGLFTCIVAPTLYFVARKGLRHTSSLAAFAMTVALYTVAATYTLAVLTHAPTFVTIGTAVLTITIVFSNAVVWSRVWVLWGYNRVLCAASFLFLAITLVPGALSTVEGSRIYLTGDMWLDGFYWGSEVGLAVFWMFMCTNGLTLILYLVKVLRMPRSEKTVCLSAGRRVARHFVRTLESGALFGVLALLMLTSNMGAGDGALPGTVGFSFFLNGAVISLLGASAVGIILLAATGYSETAFLDNAADDQYGLPLPVSTGWGK